MPETNPTACLLVIGNEVLSGRTQDANIRFLATGLGEIGIPLREVRVIPDVPDTIVTTVNEVRAKFDYVFTTGGIGPTHDDITSECVAAAFGVPWEPHPEAWARMERSYKPGEFNAARQRMATMPRGATLIDNAMSVAPGFQIGNVYVMAGVPRVMQSMFEWLAPRLKGGAPIVSRAVHVVGLPEGIIAAPLGEVQAKYPDIDIGSYPFYRPSGNGVAIVAKGTDAAAAASGDRRGDGDHHRLRQGADTRRAGGVSPMYDQASDEPRQSHRRVAAARPQARHDQQAVVVRRADLRLAVQRDQRVAPRDHVAAAIGLHEGEVAGGRRHRHGDLGETLLPCGAAPAAPHPAHHDRDGAAAPRRWRTSCPPSPAAQCWPASTRLAAHGVAASAKRG